VERLNRSAYLDIVTGYEPPSPDGKRHLALVIALEIDNDRERLNKQELGAIDESIRAALHYTLVGRLGALQTLCQWVWKLFMCKKVMNASQVNSLMNQSFHRSTTFFLVIGGVQLGQA
jgi:hypothetical protein